MHLVNKGHSPKGGQYFECSTARRKAGCDNSIRWRVDAIERRLLQHLPYIDADAVLRGEMPTGEVERVDSLRAKLVDLTQQIENVAEMVAIAKGRDPVRLNQYEKLVQAADAKRAELAEAEKALAKVAADPGLRARLTNAVDLSKAMDEAEGEQRTAIRTRLAEQLRQLVDAIHFHPEVGVVAALKTRLDIPADQIPFMHGTAKNVPWLLSLDHDMMPHGPEPMTADDEPIRPIAKLLPSLAHKLAVRKKEGGSR
jgi:hypothetical protein